MEESLFIALETHAHLSPKESFDHLVDHISGLNIEDENFKLYQLTLGEKHYVAVKIKKHMTISPPLTYFKYTQKV